MAIGWADMTSGRLDEGLLTFREALEQYQLIGMRSGLGLFLANSAIALLAGGAPAEGSDYVADARHELETTGSGGPNR